MRNGRNDSWNYFLFVYLRFIFYILHVGNFQVPPVKSHPHPKSLFDLSAYYINLKNGSIAPPSSRGDANYEIPLDMSMYIFNCKKTVEAIILKSLQGHP